MCMSVLRKILISVYNFKYELFYKFACTYPSMVPTDKEILFFRTKYTRFKGNKSRYVQKNVSYLFNV